MEKFLQRAAKHIYVKHGNNLSHVTVLLPNHRSCVYFLNELKKCTEQTLWSPEVSTLQDWVFEESNLHLMQPPEQLLMLYKIYCNEGGHEPADDFFGTAQTMLNDFNEVDEQLADAKNFFFNLEQLQSLNVYEPGGELSEYSIRYKKFWKLFSCLYFSFREHCIKASKGYAGMLYRDVAERISELQLDISKIYLVGFSGLSKCEEEIFSYLMSSGLAEIICDSDTYYEDDDAQEAGMFFRNYKKKWRIDNELCKSNLIADQPKNIHIIGVAKNVGQTKAAADILSSKLQLNEESQKETALIVLDEKMLAPLVRALPGNISSLNISMGLRLNDTPAAELVKAIFSLHENIERFKTADSNLRFYYRDVLDLLHHPYVASLFNDSKTIDQLATHVRSYNRMLVTAVEIEKFLPHKEREILFWYTSEPILYVQKLTELTEALSATFLRIAKGEGKDFTEEIEVLYQLCLQLKNIQNLIADGEFNLSTSIIRKLLLEMLHTVRVPFEGEPVRGLQVMGMMETRCLDFKNIILLSMNEGIFPSGKGTNTYIPYDVRKEFLTTHKQKDAVSSYLFYRLLQHAENIFLLYNTEPDELGGGEKSRFILQLQHELKAVNPKANINELIYSVAPPPPVSGNEISIVKDEKLLQFIRNNLSGYGISPSAINTYINCSLQYYLRYVAGLREQDDMEENIDASTLGSAVHYVLENIYKEVVGKSLTPYFFEQALTNKLRIEQLLKESFAGRFDDESLANGKNYLLYRVCLKLVDEFLKQELAQVKGDKTSIPRIKILMLETEMVQPLIVSGFTVNIRGKVDRVEEKNGIINIADYKTGSDSGNKLNVDDLKQLPDTPKFSKAMQLLMYAWMYWSANGKQEVNLRSGIYWLRNSSKGFDTLEVDGNDVITKSILESFENVLCAVIEKLLSPDIPFTKTEDIKRCTYCEFAKICSREKPDSNF